MKLMYSIFLLFLISAFSRPAGLAVQSEITHIRFGNGGGFSGIETVYSLDKAGQILNIQETAKGKNSTQIKYIGKKSAKPYFEKARELKGYTYNVPGDTYAFLELRGETIQRIVWGDSTKVDPRVLSLYNELTTLIR